MESNILTMAEGIEELTEGRIPFDRACWIALYIERVTNGMSHEDAIKMEEDEHAERGQPSPYDHGTDKAILVEMTPQCEQCGEPFSMAHDCTRGDHHYTAGKPQSKVGQYISCQHCHRPAGDQRTKANGYCHDCEAKTIAAGHQREDEKERARR